MDEGEEAGAILRVGQALGIFCLERACRSTRRRVAAGRSATSVVLLTLCWPYVAAIAPGLQSPEVMAKPRRQQGILTGMPFMANLASRTFVDALGRKLYVANPPSRVISLAPSITEILYALDLGERIAGVTPYCNFPPEAQLKPKVSYTRPNLEAIVAQKPDLVLAPIEFLRVDLLKKLEQLKISVFVLESKTVEDIYAHVQTLGRMFGRASQADRLAADLRRRVGELKGHTDGLPRPRLLYVLNSEPLITVGPGSFIHHLIELAGGHNIAGQARSAYPRFSMEAVIRADPEVIVFPVGEAEGIPEDQQLRWRRWTSLTAVQQERFHRVPADLLNRPGPRIVQGLEALARIVHPEAFQEPTGR